MNEHPEQPFAPMNPSEQEPEIDLGSLIAGFLDSWVLITSATVVVLALSLAYAFATKPMYQANSLLQVQDKNNMLAGFKDISEMFSGSSEADTEIQIIKSRSVLEAAVRKQHLEIEVSPVRFPLFGGGIARRWEAGHQTVASPWFGMASYGWGGELCRVERFDVPRSLENVPFEVVAEDGGKFALYGPDERLLGRGSVGEALSVTLPSGKSVALFIQELNANPGTRFHLVNHGVSTAADALAANLSVAEQGKNTGIIQLTLKGPNPDELEKTLDAVDGAYLLQNVDAMSAEADKTLKFVQGQLPDLKDKVDRAETALNDYQAKTGTVDMKMETESILGQSVDVEKELSELQLQKADLLQRFTPSHPVVISLDQKLAQLARKKSEIDDQMKKLPEATLTSVKLMRDVQVATDMYLLLVNKAQELQIVKSGTVGTVRIVDSAASDARRPIWPKKGTIVFGGLLLGFLVGVGLAMGKQALERGLSDPDVVERSLGIPVYATIPHSAAQEKLERAKASPRVLAATLPNDVAVESLRSLRTSTQFALPNPGRGTLLFAGLRPSVGKSFVSANIAQLLASTEKRVLLVDGDMRRGVLHELFGLERAQGLSEAASGSIEFAAAVKKTQTPSLDLATSGTLPPNPAELILGERFRAFLKFAEESYDFVVVDAPPILAVTDAALLGSMTQATLLVLKAGVHPVREITLGLSRFQQASVKVAGVVLNDLPLRSSVYSYGKYGYNYSYEYK